MNPTNPLGLRIKMDKVEEEIIKQRSIANRHVYSRFDSERQISAIEKLAMLEPIFKALKDLQDRIHVLENKKEE